MPEPKKSLPKHRTGRMVFSFALTRKKWEKGDVATTIGMGFSLHPTLARFGVDFVYLGKKNIEDQKDDKKSKQYKKDGKTFAYL